MSPGLGPASEGYVGRVWFSSANATGRLVTRPPMAEKGYGPSTLSNAVMIVQVWSASSLAASPRATTGRCLETAT